MTVVESKEKLAVGSLQSSVKRLKQKKTALPQYKKGFCFYCQLTTANFSFWLEADSSTINKIYY